MMVKIVTTYFENATMNIDKTFSCVDYEEMDSVPNNYEDMDMKIEYSENHRDIVSVDNIQQQILEMCKCLSNYEKIKKKLSMFSQEVFNNGYDTGYDEGYRQGYSEGWLDNDDE